MNKSVLIVEHSTSTLAKPEQKNPNKFMLDGIFTEFNVENRNKRFYTAENFIPKMNLLLEKKALLGVLYGEFDHPDNFEVLGQRASHVIESLVYNEAENRIDGSIGILSNRIGSDVRAIINDGYPLFVSSRAAGVTDGSGNVFLKELCTYDIVLDPGFASAKMAPRVMNEKLGYGETFDVPYRIYEMNDIQVNNLFNDNKNDLKTMTDLKQIQEYISGEMGKLRTEILEKISSGKVSSTDILTLTEQFEIFKNELTNVTSYLNEMKPKMAVVIENNTKIKEELEKKIEEQTEYSTHIATQVKELNNTNNTVAERFVVVEKMLEYVAEHTAANILFTGDIAESVKSNNKLLEDVTADIKVQKDETAITQKFAEQIAEHVKGNTAEILITQKFAEQIASETVATFENVKAETTITQSFLEYVAEETQSVQNTAVKLTEDLLHDDMYLTYIREKVDGIISYTQKTVDVLKSNTPVVENATSETIHAIESIEDYLGITKETEILNNISTENTIAVTEDVNEDDDASTEENTEENTDADSISTEVTEEPAMDDNASTEVTELQPPSVEVTEEPTIVDAQSPALNDNVIDLGDVQNTTEPIVAELPTDATIVDVDTATMDNITTEEPIAGADSIVAENPENVDAVTQTQTDLISALVKIVKTEDTGIVIEITPEGKLIIQKSGTSDMTEPMDQSEVEVLDTENNVTENINHILAEIKKQKVLENTVPHFFSFLSETQVAEFKSLDKKVQEACILALNESEYTSDVDVLNVIKNTINDKAMSYEDKIVNAVPADLKDAWNELTVEHKKAIIAESKYFNLTTSKDVQNYLNTCGFAKALKSPEAVMIKESLKSEDTLTDAFVASFSKSLDNLK